MGLKDLTFQNIGKKVVKVSSSLKEKIKADIEKGKQRRAENRVVQAELVQKTKIARDKAFAQTFVKEAVKHARIKAKLRAQKRYSSTNRLANFDPDRTFNPATKKKKGKSKVKEQEFDDMLMKL